MPGSINKLWIAIGLPAILAAAIGATVAFAQDDAPTAGEGSALFQQEPTPSPTPDSTAPGDDTDDGTTPEKDCPRDGGSGGTNDTTPSSGSTTGISFRRR